MATKNTDATRFYSDMQEKRVVNKIGGRQTANSGAGRFQKGDVQINSASMLIECKTPTTKKDSFSIKKEWIDKNKEEAHQSQLLHTAIAITFEPDTENYFLIDEKLMSFLVQKLEQEEEN